MTEAEKVLRNVKGGGTTSYEKLSEENVPPAGDEEDDPMDIDNENEDHMDSESAAHILGLPVNPTTPHDTQATESISTPRSYDEVDAMLDQLESSPVEVTPVDPPEAMDDNPIPPEDHTESNNGRTTPASHGQASTAQEPSEELEPDRANDQEEEELIETPWTPEVRAPTPPRSFRPRPSRADSLPHDDDHVPDHYGPARPRRSTEHIYLVRELFQESDFNQELPTPWCYHVMDDVIYLASTLSTSKMSPEERSQFMEAKRKELQEFFSNHVWSFAHDDEVDEHRTMRAKWVLKWSTNTDGTPRAKARLVIQGYNDPDALDGLLETSSPTASRLSRLLLISEAARRGWNLWTADVATAFLQAEDKDRNIFVRLPADAAHLLGSPPGTRMRLHKPSYGTVDAPRGWFKKAIKVSTECKFIQHSLDPCFLLSYRTDGSFDGAFVIHVDDLLGAGAEDFTPDGACYASRVEELKKKLTFRSWSNDNKMEYCGVKVVQGPDRIELTMTDYLHKLAPITINKDRKAFPQTSCTSREVTQLRALLGGLQWPAAQALPHLQSSTSILQGEIGKATINTMMEANKLLKFAKNNSDVGLTYIKNKNPNPDTNVFIVYSDAALAVRSDLSSQGGYIIATADPRVLQGETVDLQIVDWSSRKLPRVCRSSLSAEAQAAGIAVDAMEYVQLFHNEMVRTSSKQSILITDCKSLYDAALKDNHSHGSDRRTSIEIAAMTGTMGRCNMTWRWVDGGSNLADGLTKLAARQSMCDWLRSGVITIIYDPDFVAAKKKTKNKH